MRPTVAKTPHDQYFYPLIHRHFHHPSSSRRTMRTLFRNTAAVVLGAVVGGAVNMGIILLGPHIIPPPAGAILTTEEGLKQSMHLLGPQHFLMPFLAHALGTLVGAFIAGQIARTRRMLVAMIVGALNLIGGAFDVAMLPSPLWFSILDLVGAYIPTAYLGWRLG